MTATDKAPEKTDTGLVTLTIDGVQVSVPKDTLVIRAAEQVGVQIPRFCDHPLLDQCDNILGRSFCALGDGATSPISSSIQYFREEYLAHLEHGGCPFDPLASTAFAAEGAHA